MGVVGEQDKGGVRAHPVMEARVAWRDL